MILVSLLNFEGVPIMFERANPANTFQDSYKTTTTKADHETSCKQIYYLALSSRIPRTESL